MHRSDFAVTTAAGITDSDGDGLPDSWETENGLNPNNADDATMDADQDGLTNLEEYLLSTNPNNQDSDGDGINDLNDVTGSSDSGGTEPGTEAGSVPYDFETTDKLGNWDFSSNSPWAVTTEQAASGNASLASGTISDNQSSDVSLSEALKTGTLSFDYKVSSEEGFDYLQFYFNDELKEQWSGEVNWAKYSMEVTEGTHKLMWRYVKDEEVKDGADKAWIDNVELKVPDEPGDGGDSPKKHVAYDYDGDGKADVGIRRPSNYHQYIRNTSDNALQRVVFGLNENDIPISGDFDGDGIADVAVRRPSNQFFYVKNSSDGKIQRFNFGRDAADIPVPGDYDGDGKTDVAVRRASNQFWYILNSSDGEIQRIRFGLQETDIPVPADYDGDGKTDLAVRRPGNFTWYIRQSSNGEIVRKVFGRDEADIPVPADYDGDGKADVAVRRASNQFFYILNSSDNQIQRFNFGRQATDIPIVADYDGDGKADVAVRRPSAFTQYILRSSDGQIGRIGLGRSEADIPLAAPISIKMTMAAAASTNSGARNTVDNEGENE